MGKLEGLSITIHEGSVQMQPWYRPFLNQTFFLRHKLVITITPPAECTDPSPTDVTPTCLYNREFKNSFLIYATQQLKSLNSSGDLFITIYPGLLEAYPKDSAKQKRPRRFRRRRSLEFTNISVRFA